MQVSTANEVVPSSASAGSNVLAGVSASHRASIISVPPTALDVAWESQTNVETVLPFPREARPDAMLTPQPVAVLSTPATRAASHRSATLATTPSSSRRRDAYRS